MPRASDLCHDAVSSVFQFRIQMPKLLKSWELFSSRLGHNFSLDLTNPKINEKFRDNTRKPSLPERQNLMNSVVYVGPYSYTWIPEHDDVHPIS